MRISPPPEEGVHPAFPASPDPSNSHTVLPQTAFFATAAGFLRLAVAFTFRQPTPLALASKTVASTAAVVGTSLSVLQLTHDVGVRRFLSSQNVDLPKAQFFDRLGSVDRDDCLIFGVCLGLLAATSMRKPWTITGWRRQLTAFTLGSFASDFAYSVYRNFSMTAEQKLQLMQAKSECDAQRMAWAPQVAEYNPLMVWLRSKMSFEVDGSVVGTGRQHNTGEMTGSPMEHLTKRKFVEDGPHRALQSRDGKEAVPVAITNYTWSSSQPIQDLKQHIASLTERRQRLSREAEFLWAWLSEKEAQYYNHPEAKGDPDTLEARTRLHYLEQLGKAHASVWREVSHCDWMIADSQKRIEQLQSKKLSDNGNVTWRAGCTEAAREAKPEQALQEMQDLEREVTDIVIQSRHSAAKAAAMMPVNASTEKMMEKMFNEIQNKVTTTREYLDDVDREIKKAMVDQEAVLKAVRELKADLERR